ncbi:phosphatidate cytidylyltransferase [Candidatus Phytoplasma palmae]|uniref:phosphatidate cytidylyltransferase n=1 Tax=Candidatus Phytoplasma palmae TaxID=85624 RepID=UPI003990C08F
MNISNKIYIGLTMFLLNLFSFYFLFYIDKNYGFSFFIYFCLFLVLILIFQGSNEILNLQKPKKERKNFYPFIFLIFFFNFFLFVSIIIKSFQNNNIIHFGEKIQKTNLFQTLNFLINNNFFLFYFLLFIFVLFLFFLFKYNFKINNLSYIFLSLVYIVFFSSCFFSLIILNYQWYLYIFIITITYDSFSYFGGNLFGKNYLCSKLSPKKTWEGFFCGFLVTLIMTLIFFIDKLISIQSYCFFILFILLSCIVSQLGDLIASKFKRNSKLKDFNNIFPGHGGLIDRLDSLLFLSFFIVTFILSPLKSFSEIILNIIKT